MRQKRWRPTGVLRRLRGRDEGAALVVVVGSMLVLAMLAMTALAYSMSGQRFARYDQDYSAAMAAAQSGIDDFISRMDREATYGVSPDCTNEAWRGPTTTTNSCGWTSTTEVGWAPVEPGATGVKDAYYHYTVDATNKSTQGTVVLAATGRVNGVYRTVQATIGKGGSTDYVYYTDFESADPSNVQAYGEGGTTRTQCGAGGYSNARYFYQGRSGCQEITFISGDVLDGAVFTNDAVLSDGATFKKGFQTAYPQCASAGTTTSSWNNNCLRSGSSANFNSIKPLYAQPKYLDDNSAAFATNPGCHYYGATRVVFRADGKMTVWNRQSVNGGRAPVAIAAPGGPTPVCGDLTSLDNGALLDVPDEMVIYAATSGVANRRCYGGEIGGTGADKLPVGTYAESHLATPTDAGQSYTYDTNMTETTKYCGQGNLYAEGVLNGRVTISAEQSVVVTGDLVLAGGSDTGDDMLGLVATNSVEVFHPRQVTVSSVQKDCRQYSGSGSNRRCVAYNYAWGSPSGESEVANWPKRYADPSVARNNPTSGIQIAGSIQTLQHSFLVQKYNVGGNGGTLFVKGSIAQRWRGIVGQGSGASMNGYTKLYQYDTRLQFSRPPYFPTWANSQWSLRYSGEISTPTEIRG
jgi:Tfp pilus assembly protein PilX